MTYRRPSIEDIGVVVASCLAEGDEDVARRLVFRFVEEFDRASEADRPRMIAHPPVPTGEVRYDAMLAAVVEDSCVQWDVIPPAWVDDADRFLLEWWFVSGMKSLHANALVHSPVSFKRRGVFITEGTLAYA